MSDDTLEFNLDDLTIAEICEIEELTGQPFDALNDPTKPKGKMLQAMAFISKRRTNPDFTFEDAGDIKISVTSDEVGPTNADE
jgi:hypothetical protein